MPESEPSDPRELAFRGRPADGAAALSGASDPQSRWLLGVCLGATGRYGEAFEVLAGVTGTPWAGFAASTLGSLHRQLGRHAAGLELDERALTLSESDPDAYADALLGRAADAVGLGDPDEAASWWAEAAAVVDAGWRPRVRLRWVEAEIALLRGDPEAAVGPALAAVAGARDARAARHEAKSLMFAGVALAESPGDEARGLEVLRLALAEAIGLGCDPLVLPIGAYLAAKSDAEAVAAAAAAAAAAAGARDRIAGHLPDDLRGSWLARV